MKKFFLLGFTLTLLCAMYPTPSPAETFDKDVGTELVYVIDQDVTLETFTVYQAPEMNMQTREVDCRALPLPSANPVRIVSVNYRWCYGIESRRDASGASHKNKIPPDHGYIV